jgi:hypothetical protein
MIYLASEPIARQIWAGAEVASPAELARETRQRLRFGLEIPPRRGDLAVHAKVRAHGFVVQVRLVDKPC